MKKEEILREELTRMRQLMGMNGSLYQNAIMEDEQESEGHGEEPNPKNYKGGAKGEAYQAAQAHWEKSHQSPPPSPPPPSPPPSPVSGEQAKKSAFGKTKALSRSPKKGTSSKGSMDGSFVLPAGAIPKFGNTKFGKKSGKKAGKKNKKKEDY